MMRGAIALGAAAALLVAGTASAAPQLRITAFRVLKADGRTPATQPLARGVRYTYRLDYRIGGRKVVRVRRAGTFWSPYRDRLIDIVPRPQLSDPGRHFASGRLLVKRADSPGEYRLTYAVTARASSGATTRRAELRMRFR
ncbi:MAG: hypothetical protein ISP32_01930 [Thermoleophilia bacterium]|nr:hypothetical protein [Thermoleophilia bacterium]